jgi:hypothetical protein
VSPTARKFLLPFFVVDAIFIAAIMYWVFARPHGQASSTPGKPDIQVVLRSLEPKLTEIDLLNKGDAPGSLDLAVDVSWQDSDLDRTQGLAGFDEIDTGRMSVRFHPHAWPSGFQLSPAENRAIGWVQLKDQSPLHAEIVTGPAATQP